MARLFLSLVLALAGAGRLAAFDNGGPRVIVTFFEPAHFTDVSEGFPAGSEPGRDDLLAELRSYLVRRALRHVAAGQKLTITITDVDLAGDFEPWRGPQWTDVRVVKDIYPPRIALTFLLTDARGNLLRSGRRELTDLAFLMKLPMGFRDDRLRHEKELINDWLAAEFPVAKGQ